MWNRSVGQKSWGIVLAGCLVLVLGGFAYFYGADDRVEPAPFLSQASLEHAIFHDQWQQFRQKADISEEAMLEEFHLIHDKQQNTVSIRMRIMDKVDGQVYSYLYRKCYSCPTQEEIGQDILKKRERDDQLPVPQLVKADDFFRILDAGMQNPAISRNEFSYYLIVSYGTYESIALPGTYYRVKKSGLEQMTFPDRPEADGFHIEIIGSETQGPFSSGDKNVHFIFS